MKKIATVVKSKLNRIDLFNYFVWFPTRIVLLPIAFFLGFFQELGNLAETLFWWFEGLLPKKKFPGWDEYDAWDDEGF